MSEVIIELKKRKAAIVQELTIAREKRDQAQEALAGRQAQVVKLVEQLQAWHDAITILESQTP